tara:strand:+ start:49 stop:621 length:573 start_codon:yes stop_codon:yes gene_type:complete
MNKDLLRDNYLIVRNFISIEQAKTLAKGFLDENKRKSFDNDTQVINSLRCGNSPKGLEVLCYESLKVTKLVETCVLPTYTFTRIYKKGNELVEHTDREACEISVTVHLDGDNPWSFWIKTPEGKPVGVDLQSGDAMIYLGCIAPHWRNTYTGNTYVQMFLHYIKSGGKYHGNYFDRKDYLIKTLKDKNIL